MSEPSGPSPAHEELPLATTKLLPPRHRAGLVDRARVSRLLDRGDGPFVLVSAAVGYGKTTAVRAWAEERGDALAWVTLDAGDNDPVRLWTYVAAAVNGVREGLGRRCLQRLAGSHGSVLPALDELAGGLHAYGEPLVIVLDDLQEVASIDAVAPLDHLVERLPGNVRLVALTRSDPALRLARLRARGLMTELRSADLSFTVDEASALFAAEHVPVSDQDVAALVARTEGWPAGLYLAALWLREQADVGSDVRAFAGDHRHVATYLAAEVLDGLEPELRAFLTRSSVLGTFTAELCDVALEREGSARALGELERTNLFLVPLDERGDWFRYHALFAEVLRLELDRTEPGAARPIHRRASAWLRERGHIADASAHASAAGDHREVAVLLAQHYHLLIDHGLSHTILRWMRTLPLETLHEVPTVVAMSVVASGLAREPVDERRRLVALADEIRRSHPERWSPELDVLVGIAVSAMVDRDVGAAVDAGRLASSLAEGHVADLVSPAFAAFAHACLLAGDTAGAAGAARRAIEHPSAQARVPAHFGARAVLALAELERGRPDVAGREAAAARALAEEHGLGESWVAGIVAEALAALHLADGRLGDAEREATRAVRLHHGVSLPAQARALALRARIRIARGRLTAAGVDLAEARDLLADMVDAGQIGARVDEGMAELEAARRSAERASGRQAPTTAELAVLRLLTTELTLAQVAGELFLSRNTVKTHTRSLYRKLGVRSRTEAVARAEALGLL